MRRIYGALLRLYPRDHRTLFAAEMLAVLEKVAEERRGRGWAAFIRLTLAEVMGLLTGAGAEWVARLTSRPLSPTPVHPPDELTEAQRHIDLILRSMDYAIANHQFTKARFLSEAERRARERLRQCREKHKMEG
jgi:hypothetical protein